MSVWQRYRTLPVGLPDLAAAMPFEADFYCPQTAPNAKLRTSLPLAVSVTLRRSELHQIVLCKSQALPKMCELDTTLHEF